LKWSHKPSNRTGTRWHLALENRWALRLGFVGIPEHRSIESDPCERWSLGNQEEIFRQRKSWFVAERKFQSASNRSEKVNGSSNLNFVDRWNVLN